MRQALGGLGPPIKWIGDEAMFGFPDPATALQVLGRLLPACRSEPRIPLTRTGLNHGPVLRRSNDLFGSTVNIAARIAAFASPGQLLATQPVANIAAASGIVARDIGKVALRSIADHVPLYSIELAPAFDPAWIDPVCKMHAPYEAYRRTAPTEPWFCSDRCAERISTVPGYVPSLSGLRPLGGRRTKRPSETSCSAWRRVCSADARTSANNRAAPFIAQRTCRAWRST